jgi:hypothetical protein
VRSGDSIEDFAGDIARGGLILAVISHKSLRSDWCMVHELLQAFRRRNFDSEEFGSDVLALVLEDALDDIWDPRELVRYWLARLEQEQELMQLADPGRTGSPESWKGVDQLAELCRKLPDLIRPLRIRAMPRGAEAIREKDFHKVRQLVLKRLQDKTDTPRDEDQRRSPAQGRANVTAEGCGSAENNIKKLEELDSVFEYEKMFDWKDRDKEKKMTLSHAKGFLGEYLSANLSLRKKIRGFVEQLTTYSLCKGRARPLNCLVTAPPGSGKSFFVQQLAKEIGCGLVEINLSQITTTDELVRGISQLNDIQTGTPMLFLDEIDSNPEFFRFLLSPLWEASVLVNGKKIKWSERFIAILAASQNPFDVVPPNADHGLLERLKSRINGPELKLMESGIDREQQEENRIRTSSVYLLVDIILRYHKNARLVETRIMDLIYCAEIDRFNARSLEHFISAFPSPNDGIVKLSNVPPQKLGEFLDSLGYKMKDPGDSLIKHPLNFESTTKTGSCNQRIGSLYRERLARADGIIHTDSLDRSLVTIIA